MHLELKTQNVVAELGGATANPYRAILLMEPVLADPENRFFALFFVFWTVFLRVPCSSVCGRSSRDTCLRREVSIWDSTVFARYVPASIPRPDA